MFGGKAKKENDVLRHRVAELEQRILALGGGELARIEQIKADTMAQIDGMTAHCNFLANEIQRMEGDRRNIDVQIAAEKQQLIDARDANTLQSFGYFDFANPAEDSVRLEAELDRVRVNIKALIRAKQAIHAATGFTFNNSTAKGKSFVNKLSKIALRSYNAEVENAVARMKAGNLQAGIRRIERAKNEVERLGDMIDLRVNPEFHRLRVAELTLAFQHLEAKKALKDQEREERARLREERKAQQEMEAERRRLEKEQAHYSNVLETLREQGRHEEAATMEAKLAEIEKGIADVDYRAANIRAGYVYVISNIGSFGEKMVKIGMTRRLTPMDRVKELGDASVPFNFDVHALHFSDDAVGLEAELHRRFAHVKVNRVNTRREFFYATPSEVKEVLSSVDGSVLEYRDEPEAEQFRLSQDMAATTQRS